MIVVLYSQVTREFFWALPELGSQRRIVTCLLDVETTTKCAVVSTAVRSCLKQVGRRHQLSHDDNVRQRKRVT